MAFTYPKIIGAAKASGLPYNPTSTYRPGAVTKSGKVSFHAKGQAVDFWGMGQDALAAYFIGRPHREVFHKSLATGRWYGSSNGNPVDEATHAQLVKDHEDHLHVAANDDDVVGNPTSNPVLGFGSTLAKGLLSPWDAAASLVDVMRPVGVLSSMLVRPDFWRRLGMGAMGGTLVLFGILYLNRRPIGNTVSAVGGALGSVAGTAVQGAAFGAGAGATGGLGAVKSKSVPPASPPGPYPPRRALPSNAPVTAVLPEAYAPVSSGGTYEVTAVGRARRPAAGLPDSSGLGGKPRQKKSSKSEFKPSVSAPLRNAPRGGQ